MDTPSDPDDERLERRLRLGVRLVFYPLALGLIVFAWHARHRGEASADPVHVVIWSGLTAQGRPVRAALDDDGRLVSLDTELSEPCADGTAFTLTWYPRQSAFIQHGDDVDGHTGPQPSTDSYGEPTVSETRLRGHLGAHPYATLTGQVVRTTTHGRVVCRSEPVTFTLHKGAPTVATSRRSPPPPATPAPHPVPPHP
jgi:hypothetical protein